VKTVKFILQNRIFYSERAIISFNVQTPNEVEYRKCCARGDQMNMVAYMREDELKRGNVALTITLNHSPRCNISSLCDISVKLLRNNAL